MINFPAGVNVELTSRCNKSCYMCGRRQLEKEHPQLCHWGDMPLEMVERIAKQIPARTIVQLHNNGEPTLYPNLDTAILAFNHCVTGLDTNAKLLCAVAHELCNLDSLTISIIPNDPDGEEQLLNVQAYLEGDIPKPPTIVFRFLGNSYTAQWAGFFNLAREHKVKIARRQLHAPGGSYDYEKDPAMPEMGICLEALTKLSIDRHGYVSPCVRYDPFGQHRVGHVGDHSLVAILEGPKYTRFRRAHLDGRRDKASPICKTCDYWGVPRG